MFKFEEWIKEVRDLESECRLGKAHVKEQMRQGKYIESIPSYLYCEKERLTLLYSIRAHRRGKLHMTKRKSVQPDGTVVSKPWTKLDQENLVEDWLEEFESPVV